MAEIHQPWLPAEYDEPTVYAIKALAAGTANDGQQKMALDWIIRTACGTYDQTFFVDSERNSSFAQGKRHVGLQLVKLVNMLPSALEPKRQRKGRLG